MDISEAVDGFFSYTDLVIAQPHAALTSTHDLSSDISRNYKGQGFDEFLGRDNPRLLEGGLVGDEWKYNAYGIIQ